MKRFLVAALLTLGAMGLTPAYAKNLALPPKDPVATIVIPDTWEPEEIEFGYSATSPDGNVFFSVEYVSASRIDKLFAANDAWMKENKIKPKGEAKKTEFDFGGLPATVFIYDAEDEDGDTEVSFVLLPGGKNRVIMLTLWASREEQKANKADLDAIQNSVKAIN